MDSKDCPATIDRALQVAARLFFIHYVSYLVNQSFKLLNSLNNKLDISRRPDGADLMCAISTC